MDSIRSRRAVVALRAGAILAIVVVSIATIGCRRDPPAPSRTLAVCADPNNMPFSNQQGDGFENRIADLVAREIGATVRYTWFAQRRGFVRNTLRAIGTHYECISCDLWFASRVFGTSRSLFVPKRSGPGARDARSDGARDGVAEPG